MRRGVVWCRPLEAQAAEAMFFLVRLGLARMSAAVKSGYDRRCSDFNWALIWKRVKRTRSDGRSFAMKDPMGSIWCPAKCLARTTMQSPSQPNTARLADTGCCLPIQADRKRLRRCRGAIGNSSQKYRIQVGSRLDTSAGSSRLTSEPQEPLRQAACLT
ncbi:hypothetical protein L1887_59193 [Cichorium endivia]|nr:hypothetical protein L1887_59193 [Cichorium endivia]